jgi:hypothetical protein
MLGTSDMAQAVGLMPRGPEFESHTHTHTHTHSHAHTQVCSLRAPISTELYCSPWKKRGNKRERKVNVLSFCFGPGKYYVIMWTTSWIPTVIPLEWLLVKSE